MQNRTSRVGAASVLLSVSILAMTLAGCGDNAASLAARDHAAAGALAEDASTDFRQTSAPIRVSRAQRDNSGAAGDVAWASSRSGSGAENAQARFDRYGAEFDTATPEAYAAKARAFLRRPPAGAETIDRINGDKLVYDAKSNVFAVANDEGLPRTFFHPRDGAAYWAEQKATEAERASGGSSSSARRATNRRADNNAG